MVYEEIVRELNRQGVDYVVAGGVAMVMHGVVRLTADFDIIASLDNSNLKRLLIVMKKLGFRPKAPVKPEDLLDPACRQDWMENKNLSAFSFNNPSRPIMLVDILLRVPIEYAKLKAGAERLKFGRLTAPVVSIKDLIKLKEASGREQDLEDSRALKGLTK